MEKKKLYFMVIALAVFALDQIIKAVVFRVKPSGAGFFSINYATNTGAAFGILKNGNLFLIILSIAVLAAIIYLLFFYLKKQPKGVFVFSALLFAGALGNLADRLFRGFVIDFLDFSFWPAFNIADIAITVGVIGLVYYIYKE